MIAGANSCPGTLLQKLWLTEDCNQAIPYFDETEIANLIGNHDLYDPQRIADWTRAIFITTGGHPQLVHARVRNLQSKNWPPLEGATVFQTVDLEQEKDFARQRLMDEVLSDNARSLAYRLSVLPGQFSRQIAITLAEISPIISLPGEALDALVGPWIEKLSEGKFRVSPLLQNAGDKILSLVEIQAVHQSIASGIAQQKTLTPYDFGTGLLHAIIAKSEVALSVLVAGTIRAASREVLRALADVAFWFPSMALKPHQRICEMSPTTDVLIRVLQFKMAAAAGKVHEAGLIVDRTTELVENLPPSKESTTAAVMAYSTFLISLDTPVPARMAINMLSKVMDLAEADEEIAKLWRKFEQRPDLPLAGLSIAQLYLHIRASKITSLRDLEDLLDALEALNSKKRSHVLLALKDGTGELADLLIGGAWSRDAVNDRLNVDQGITILRNALNYGRQWNIVELVRAGYVAIAVLYDEYGSDSKSALQVLEEASKELGEHPKIVNQRAKVFFGLKTFDRALELFQLALEGDGLSAIEKTFSSRLAGISSAHLEDWQTAERLFLDGAETARLTAVQQNTAIGLMADAAFARWKQGRRRDSLALYVDVLNELESIPIDENLSNRQLHAIVRHCLAWINSSGQLNDRGPPPGSCSNPDPHSGLKDLKIIPMPAVWGLLGTIDIRLGTGLGLMKLAEEKHKTELPILIRVYERAVKYEAIWRGGNFAEASPIIVAFIEACTYQKQFQEPGLDLFALFVQCDEIPRLPAEY